LTLPATGSIANARMTLSPPSTPPAGALTDSEVPVVLLDVEPRLLTNEMAANALVGCPAGRRANRLAAVSSVTMMALLTMLVKAEFVAGRRSDRGEAHRSPSRASSRNRRSPHATRNLVCSKQIIDGLVEFMRAGRF